MRVLAAPLVLGAIVLALSACGSRRDLKPAAGKALPPAPYGREEPRSESLAPGTYARADLHPGARIAGPSIVTEFDSTTVVLEGYTAEIDRYFNLLIRKA